jgi:hypothetical protein
MHKSGDFIGRVNYVLTTFSQANDGVKRELFNKQCCHLYGSETWQLSDPDVIKFSKTWNHGARRVFNLLRCMHTRFLQHFVGRQHVMDQIYKRSYKLIRGMLQSKNLRVASLARLMIVDSSSIIAQNIQCMCVRYDFSYYTRFNGFNYKDFKTLLSSADQETLLQIDELRDALRDQVHIDKFDKSELYDIIDFLCCF